MKQNNWSRVALTSALGVALSYAFVLLAALPIRHLRLTYGRNIFWLSTAIGLVALTGAGMWMWALIYFSISLLIGFYRELEEKKTPIFFASSLAILATTSLNAFAILGASQWQNLGPRALLVAQLEPAMNQLKELPQFQGSEIDQLLWYLPSALIITMMLVLFVSLVVSRSPQSLSQRQSLRNFSLPDWAVWCFIGGLGATFIPEQGSLLSLVAMNILTVTLAAYFFQGLAVLNYFMDRMQLFGIWRLLAYFLAFFQLFLFVSGLGILDYWFDFRNPQASDLQTRTFNH